MASIPFKAFIALAYITNQGTLTKRAYLEPVQFAAKEF